MFKGHSISLRSELITIFVALVIASMLVLIVVDYYSDFARQKAEYIAYTEDMLELSSVNLKLELRQILDLTLTPYMNEEFFSFLTGKGITDKDFTVVENSMISILNSNNYISQVHIFSAPNNESYVARNYNLYRKRGNEDNNRPLDYDVSIAFQKQHSYGISFNRNPDDFVFTISRNLYNLPEKRYIGRIDIDVDLGFFVDANSSLFSNPHEVVVVIDQNGIIYSYPYDNDLEYIVKNFVFENELGTFTAKNNGDDLSLIYRKVSPGTGMKPIYLLKIVDNSIIISQAKSDSFDSLIIGIAITMLSVLLVWIFAFRFFEPFGYLEGQLAKIADGNLNVSMDLRDSKEFSRISSQFNAMISTINNVIIQNYQLEIENKNNQLKALQAQLDPHFINNTLQTIGAKALKKGNFELYTDIFHFGEMMRYIMNFSEMQVLFRDELEYTKNYLDFQKKRFEKRLDYIIDASPSVFDLKIPRLLIQPIAENSIKHGFGTQLNGFLLISIYASIKDDYFFLQCKNSGVGLSSEELNTLRSSIEKARFGEVDSSDIGLRNLARRLQILYGDNAILEVDSKDGKGFSVILQIPIGELHG